MCIDIGTALSIVSGGIQVVNALRRGNDAGETFDAQASSSMIDARRALVDAQASLEVATVAASKTRLGVREAVSTARARYAASNVRVDTGSAADVQRDIATRGEEDALNQVLLGQRQKQRLEDEAAAIAMEAGQFSEAGNKARKAGRIDAIGSAISSGADAYTRWNMVNN